MNMLEIESPDYASRPHNDLTRKIIGLAIEVHRTLGPGLLESAYEACLIYELQKAGLKVEWQKDVLITYKEIKLDCGYRLDLLVEDKIIIEIKSVTELTNVHKAQLLTYLKLSGCTVGLLMNFNVMVLRDGIHRIII